MKKPVKTTCCTHPEFFQLLGTFVSGEANPEVKSNVEFGREQEARLM